MRRLTRLETGFIAAAVDDTRRVFWIVDNGSAHRGQRSIVRLKQKHPTPVLVHGPLHASWLNQIEICFSILQRKALTPNDFASLAAVKDRLLSFQQHYQSIAHPLNGSSLDAIWPICCTS